MSTDELPVILVAAKDTIAADKIISELIEKDVSAEGDTACVWEISNKYYTAAVRLQALADADKDPSVVDRVEALVVYLAQHECNAETLERRAVRARAKAGGGGGGAGGAGVRLALADCRHEHEHEHETLQDAALRLNFEVVPLQAEAGDEDEEEEEQGEGPFPTLRGVARAREALHAHVWPGHSAHAHAHAHVFADEGSECASSSGGECESDPEPDDAECVRRAELLADALGAIGGVRGEGVGVGVGVAERRLRAEQLLAAFCRALGTDLDAL